MEEAKKVHSLDGVRNLTSYHKDMTGLKNDWLDLIFFF